MPFGGNKNKTSLAPLSEEIVRVSSKILGIVSRQVQKVYAVFFFLHKFHERPAVLERIAFCKHNRTRCTKSLSRTLQNVYLHILCINFDQTTPLKGELVKSRYRNNLRYSPIVGARTGLKDPGSCKVKGVSVVYLVYFCLPNSAR